MADADNKVSVGTIDEENVESLKIQIKNLRNTLKFSNDTLASDRQQKLSAEVVFSHLVASLPLLRLTHYYSGLHYVNTYLRICLLDLLNIYTYIYLLNIYV